METIIQTKRKALGLKIYDLAQQVGIDPSLMSRIISGKRKPTLQQLKKISEVLDIHYEDLLKAYLCQEVITLLTPYPQIAADVMLAAEERISYLTSEQKLNVISLSEHVKQLLTRADKLKLKWAQKKPLNQLQISKMKEYFHTAYTYESNRIEGNTLTLSETHLVVNEGITIGGKSMVEHLEAINHQEAIDLIYDFVERKVQLNSFYLKQIHQLVLKGIDKKYAGIYRDVPVRISGSAHVPPEPYLIEKMMEDYFLFYETQKNVLHPIILAAEMHERLVSIHPFIDGNGRTSRLVMNLILLQNGYPIVNLKGDFDQKSAYFQALEAVQVNHENESFYRLIIKHAIASLKEHLHLAG
jgi:Fic family protein/DNA-binding Xre family transcriptional regulator